MRKVLILAFLLAATPTWAQIAYDNSAASYCTSCSSLTFSVTVGAAGTNRLLFVGVSISKYQVSGVSGVTYAGVAMTKIRSDDYLYQGTPYKTQSSIWRLVAPSTGANNVVVTLNGSHDALRAGAISLTGIDQTSPVDAHNGAYGSSDTPSVSVTAVADNAWVLDTLAEEYPNVVLTPQSGQTARWQAIQYTAAGSGSHIGPKTPPGSQTMSWGTYGTYWAISAASLKPASPPAGAARHRVINP
jgi:hypothetical protein